MKERDPQLVKDVEELLEQSVLQEAANEVWQLFQTALESLDPESRELLELHFEGNSIKEVSQKMDLPEGDVKAWITKSKRDVIKNIGQSTKVRQ